MRWAGQIGVIGALVLGGLVTTATPAAACSCVGRRPVAEAVARADGAFVGTLVEIEDPDGDSPILFGDRAVSNRFEVEAVAKGDIGPMVEVAASASGAACGIEAAIGDRVGLALRGKEGAWTSSLCSRIDPDELAAVSGPPGPGPPSQLLLNVVLALLVGGAIVALVARVETRHDPESPKQSGS